MFLLFICSFVSLLWILFVRMGHLYFKHLKRSSIQPKSLILVGGWGGQGKKKIILFIFAIEISVCIRLPRLILHNLGACIPRFLLISIMLSETLNLCLATLYLFAENIDKDQSALTCSLILLCTFRCSTSGQV